MWDRVWKRIQKKSSIIFVIFLVILLIILILDFFNLVPDKISGISLSQIKQNKDLVYIFFGFCVSISIFANQSYTGQIQNEEYKKRLEELSAIKKDTEAIQKKALSWFNEAETHAILFYFPYTILPGFWYDGGYFFIESILNKILSMNGIIKTIFRGPSCDDKNYENILSLFINIDPKNLHNLINNMSAHFKIRTGIKDDTSEAAIISNKIRECYKHNFDNLKINITKEREEFIDISPETKNNEGYWDLHPSYSFILRMLKNYELELMLIDTFGIIEKNNHNINLFMNSEKMLEKDIFCLLSVPTLYVIQNPTVINLFVSTMFQTIFKNDEKIRKVFSRGQNG